MTARIGLDRATLVLGAVSVFSAFLALASEEWAVVRVHRGAVLVAVVLGLLAGVAGWLANRLLTLTAGVLFLVAATVLLVLLALHSSGGYLDGNASTFSFWLGLGIGLVVIGLTPRDRTT
jgi:hypothetical protein